jgi:hypothetical protein
MVLIKQQLRNIYNEVPSKGPSEGPSNKVVPEHYVNTAADIWPPPEIIRSILHVPAYKISHHKIYAEDIVGEINSS